MRRVLFAILALALLVGVAGCGQKGPLYLPDNEQTAQRDAPRNVANAPDDSES